MHIESGSDRPTEIDQLNASEIILTFITNTIALLNLSAVYWQVD